MSDMSIYEAMYTPLKEMMLIILLVLILLQLQFGLILVKIRCRAKFMVPFIIQFFCLFTLMFLLFDCVFECEHSDSIPRTWLDSILKLYDMPVYGVLLYEFFSVGYIICMFRLMKDFRKKNTDMGALKETMDLLPAGIAFANEKGKVVFGNLSINRVSLAVTGKIFTNFDSLISASEGESEGNIRKVTYPDGSKVWQLNITQLNENGENEQQLTATDVTMQVKANEELQSKNEKLKEIRRRLDIYNRQAESIIVARELLNARMQVHNETGHVLLASRNYLDHPGSIDASKLLQTLKNTNTCLLKEYEEDDTERDLLTDAFEMADSLGVNIKLNGVLPEIGAWRSILAAAINESATNIRKHADGKELRIEVEVRKQGIAYSIVSEGSHIDGPVKESGGLKSLRTLIESVDGSMEIITDSDLTLHINLPVME